jgi:hypothetical protein
MGRHHRPPAPRLRLSDPGKLMSASKVSEVVENWLRNSVMEDGDATMFDVVHDEPEVAWSAILEILEQPLTENQRVLLAAGPLDCLVVTHWQFLERINREMSQNERLKQLFGEVWPNLTMDETFRVDTQIA